MKYLISDWAGNVLFDGQTFDSFNDAWGFLYEQFPDWEHEDFEDYYVLGHGDSARLS